MPKEKAELERMAKTAKNANPADTQRFLKALDQVFRQSARLSFKERLAVLLRIDPERVGIVFRDEKTKDVIERRKGKITEYKEMLDRYETELPRRGKPSSCTISTFSGARFRSCGESWSTGRALDTDFKQESAPAVNVRTARAVPSRNPRTRSAASIKPRLAP